MVALALVAVAVGLIGRPVSAGHHRWEASTPLLQHGSNGTHRLHQRAISIRPEGGADGVYTWPNKKIKYCWADDVAEHKLKGYLTAATGTNWAALADLGFKYEFASREKCNADRINHLKIYYNDRGKFRTTNGKPPIDEAYNAAHPDSPILGPEMHLSDDESVGMLNTVSNIAHEIGHAWGLIHEHQNPKLWFTDPNNDRMIDDTNPLSESWPSYNNVNDYTFRPSQFHCTALRDYPAGLAAAQAKAQADPENWRNLPHTFCTTHAHAQMLGFSAAEYLPLRTNDKFIADDAFDPDSIMLYPSGSGGAVIPGGGRQTVLTLRNNVEITPNLMPSERDVERLRLLYSVDIEGIGELHIRGAKKDIFHAAYKKTIGHGSAKDKIC